MLTSLSYLELGRAVELIVYTVDKRASFSLKGSNSLLKYLLVFSCIIRKLIKFSSDSFNSSQLEYYPLKTSTRNFSGLREIFRAFWKNIFLNSREVWWSSLEFYRDAKIWQHITKTRPVYDLRMAGDFTPTDVNLRLTLNQSSKEAGAFWFLLLGGFVFGIIR